MTKLSPTEQRKILKAFQSLTGAEANLIWDILSMHQENELCNCEYEGHEEHGEDIENTPADHPYKVGQTLLQRIEAALVEGV